MTSESRFQLDVTLLFIIQLCCRTMEMSMVTLLQILGESFYYIVVAEASTGVWWRRVGVSVLVLNKEVDGGRLVREACNVFSMVKYNV